jgi:hypothetical protein
VFLTERSLCSVYPRHDRAVASFLAAVLTEIYLCEFCSRPEILIVVAAAAGPALESVVRPAPTCGASSRYPSVTARQHLTAMALTKSKEARYKRAGGQR